MKALQCVVVFLLGSLASTVLAERLFHRNLQPTTDEEVDSTITEEENDEGLNGSDAAGRVGYANNKGPVKETEETNSGFEDGEPAPADEGVGEELAEAEQKSADQESETSNETLGRSEVPFTQQPPAAPRPQEVEIPIPIPAAAPAPVQATGGGSPVIINNADGSESGCCETKTSQSTGPKQPTDLKEINQSIKEMFEHAAKKGLPVQTPPEVNSVQEANYELDQIETALRAATPMFVQRNKRSSPRFLQVAEDYDAEEVLEEAKEAEDEAEDREEANDEAANDLESQEEDVAEESAAQEEKKPPPKKLSNEEAENLFKSYTIAIEKSINKVASVQAGKEDFLGTDERLRALQAEEEKAGGAKPAK